MATSEERMKVLKMIQEGKLSPEEGAALLEALDESSAPGSSTSTSGKETGKQPYTTFNTPGRWFRVRVTDARTGNIRANLRIPLGVVRAGMKMGMRFSPEMQEMDMDKFMDFINNGEIGPLVDVYDDDDGEHVEVSIE